jgi:hypothetical protein
MEGSSTWRTASTCHRDPLGELSDLFVFSRIDAAHDAWDVYHFQGDRPLREAVLSPRHRHRASKRLSPSSFEGVATSSDQETDHADVLFQAGIPPFVLV